MPKSGCMKTEGFFHNGKMCVVSSAKLDLKNELFGSLEAPVVMREAESRGMSTLSTSKIQKKTHVVLLLHPVLSDKCQGFIEIKRMCRESFFLGTSVNHGVWIARLWSHLWYFQ